MPVKKKAYKGKRKGYKKPHSKRKITNNSKVLSSRLDGMRRRLEFATMSELEQCKYLLSHNTIHEGRYSDAILALAREELASEPLGYRD